MLRIESVEELRDYLLHVERIGYWLFSHSLLIILHVQISPYPILLRVARKPIQFSIFCILYFWSPDPYIFHFVRYSVVGQATCPFLFHNVQRMSTNPNFSISNKLLKAYSGFFSFFFYSKYCNWKNGPSINVLLGYHSRTQNFVWKIL